MDGFVFLQKRGTLREECPEAPSAKARAGTRVSPLPVQHGHMLLVSQYNAPCLFCKHHAGGYHCGAGTRTCCCRALKYVMGIYPIQVFFHANERSIVNWENVFNSQINQQRHWDMFVFPWTKKILKLKSNCGPNRGLNPVWVSPKNTGVNSDRTWWVLAQAQGSVLPQGPRWIMITASYNQYFFCFFSAYQKSYSFPHRKKTAHAYTEF